MFHKASHHRQHILTAGLVTAAGLLLFKYLPMSIWGRDILFDASGHVATAIFVLYIVWNIIGQQPVWRTPFYIFSAMILMVISFQRIVDNAHNDIGLLGGLILGLAAIGTAEWSSVKKQLK